MSESKTSERRLEAAERQRRALELRSGGKTFLEIARELGYRGPSGAFRAVAAGLRKTLQEPADELRRLELERLNEMQRSLWQRAVVRGNLAAIDRILRIMERRARLLGLDAPSKYEIQSFIKSDDWRQIKDALKLALANYPEAREAVAKALRGIDND